jgi:hypothetical protein
MKDSTIYKVLTAGMYIAFILGFGFLLEKFITMNLSFRTVIGPMFLTGMSMFVLDAIRRNHEPPYAE